MTISRRAHVFFVGLALLPALLAVKAQAAHISKTSGLVQVKKAQLDRWDAIASTPLEIANGDSVRTGLRASATLMFGDGSRVELGGNASFTLEEASAGRSSISLGFGRLKAFVEKLGSRRFQVRTPTAVCSVRGTEFQVDVQAGGRTTIDLYKGLLGVEDNKGQQVLMHPNERLQVDLRGMGESQGLPSQNQQEQSSFKNIMRREMALDMSKEEVQAAAARELKLAEFQQGKTLIDVFGERVRLEQYIMRPSANQFKLVILNERASRFDYFYYLGTFNTTLPTDLSIALKQVNGTIDTAPTFWLTGFETGRSNTRDSIVDLGDGGHPVDVNGNADASDDIAQFYNPITDRIEDATGRAVYQTIYDRYGFYINGGLKYGWTGANLQTYDDITASVNTDPFTGAALAVALPARSVSTTYPDASQLHQVIYESYSDGTFLKWDNYIIDDEGRIAKAADFQNLQSGPVYRNKLLEFNYQQVITASEFSGRKIDLVVAPKIFIQSGLIQ